MLTFSTSNNIVLNDGLITSVANGDLGNANTSFTYFDMGFGGFRFATLNFALTATTLTIEAENALSDGTSTIPSRATSTDGTGATIVDLNLKNTYGFATDNDLNGLKVVVTADATNPSNVGAVRYVTAYAQVSGTLTLSASLPAASTSGVTQYRLENDDRSFYGRRVSDVTTSQWTDVTLALTGSANATASGAWILDTAVPFSRVRIKRVTTNATNALKMYLVRAN